MDCGYRGRSPRRGEQVLVAIINTYGLAEAESDLLGLEEGELVVFEGSAAQLEREWSFRATSYGISIPLAAGIRLHTNTFTGKQRTDPHWAVMDSGKLSATTERIIFRGESGTIEIALDTIVGLDLLPDALQIHA